MNCEARVNAGKSREIWTTAIAGRRRWIFTLPCWQRKGRRRSRSRWTASSVLTGWTTRTSLDHTCCRQLDLNLRRRHLVSAWNCCTRGSRATPSAIVVLDTPRSSKLTVTFSSRVLILGFLQSWLLGFPVKVTREDFHEESGCPCPIVHASGSFPVFHYELVSQHVSRAKTCGLRRGRPPGTSDS